MEKQSFNDSLDSAHTLSTSKSNSLFNTEPSITPVAVAENQSSETSNPYSNANLLKDIEVLIQNMEQKHSKENESMLKNIENLLGSIGQPSSVSRPHSPQSMMSNISADPITSKSPITVRPKPRNPSENIHNISDDVRSFVSKSIQDISPDLVNQIEQELVETFANKGTTSTNGSVEDIWKSRDEDDFGARFSMQNFENDEYLNNYDSPTTSTFFHTTIEDLHIQESVNDLVNDDFKVHLDIFENNSAAPQSNIIYTNSDENNSAAEIEMPIVNTINAKVETVEDKKVEHNTIAAKSAVPLNIKYKLRYNLNAARGSKNAHKKTNKKRNSLVILEKMLNKHQQKNKETTTEKKSSTLSTNLNSNLLENENDQAWKEGMTIFSYCIK